jgi:hypothetical protein
VLLVVPGTRLWQGLGAGDVTADERVRRAPALSLPPKFSKSSNGVETSPSDADPSSLDEAAALFKAPQGTRPPTAPKRNKRTPAQLQGSPP